MKRDHTQQILITRYQAIGVPQQGKLQKFIVIRIAASHYGASDGDNFCDRHQLHKIEFSVAPADIPVEFRSIKAGVKFIKCLLTK